MEAASAEQHLIDTVCLNADALGKAFDSKWARTEALMALMDLTVVLFGWLG